MHFMEAVWAEDRREVCECGACAEGAVCRWWAPAPSFSAALEAGLALSAAEGAREPVRLRSHELRVAS